MFSRSSKAGKENVPSTRELQRQCGREQRGVEREVRRLDADERKIILQIKEAGRKRDVRQAKQLAKQLIQVRRTRERMQAVKSQLTSVKAQVTTSAATLKIAETIKNTTGIMSRMLGQYVPYHIIRAIFR
jgi:charged multivesicular body protein 3